MPLFYKAFLPLLCLTLVLTLEVRAASLDHVHRSTDAMPISYAQSARPTAPVSALPTDPFGAQLGALLDSAQDVASERVWQEIPKLIARQWASFSQYQSPLSTMGMISRAAETVLKIRLASRKGGGEEEARRLEEFQALMAEIWSTGSDEPELTVVADEGGGPE